MLAIMGASHQVFSMEETRIKKEMVGSARRMSNCDSANMDRSIEASMKHIEAIKKIQETKGRASLPETLREAVKIFIDEVLTDDERASMMRSLRGYRWWLDKKSDFGSDEEELDYYLSMCRYHAVTNPCFSKQLASDCDFGGKYAEASSAERPELAKEFAIRDFVEHVFHVLKRTGGLGRPVAVGFSDDDARNVKAVSDYIKEELVKRFRGFKFVVYDTSDASLDNGRKVTVAGQLDLPGF